MYNLGENFKNIVMKKEVLKEKIVKILEGINEPVKTNYEIADQILELLKSEKEKWLKEKYPMYKWENGKITKFKR